MRAGLILRIGAVLLLLLLGTGLAIGWVWRALHTPFQGYPGEEKEIVIESGQSASSIVRQLADEGILRYPRLCRVYLRTVMKRPTLKAGEYRFHGPQTVPDVFAKLTRGEVLTHRVTIVEGLTLEEAALHLAEQGFGSYDTFLGEMRNPALIVDLDPLAENLEGYLFPDTYAFARQTEERTIVSTLVHRARQKLTEEVVPLLDLDPLPSLREIVILASIVEKEAQLDSERPLIAAVYNNRLRRRMGLFADPTVIFALKLEGRWNGNLQRADLKIDSPYNTYRYPGLPPGPICSPGLASLLAAAQPAEAPYLYFVSRNDGSHVFANTLAQHNRNVYLWQKKFWRERWAQENAQVEGSTDNPDNSR
jgi:UPF0755 protein